MGDYLFWRQNNIYKKGTNTVQFLTHDDIRVIPKDQVVTYARIVVDLWLQKDDPNRIQITVGGNLIEYPGKLITQTADMTTNKLLWNFVISTKDAHYVCADIKGYYLKTPRPPWIYEDVTQFIPWRIPSGI